MALRRPWYNSGLYDQFFMDRPLRLFDQNFGMTLSDDDIFLPSMSMAPTWPMSVKQGLQPRRLNSRQDSGVSEVKVEKDGFEVKLDVQHFAPEELSVKSSDGTITVEGKHEEKQDEHGFVSRQFVRRYVVPEVLKMQEENVKCSLSSDGVLTISVPKPTPKPTNTEKSIPITVTGRPAIVTQKSVEPPATSTSTPITITNVSSP